MAQLDLRCLYFHTDINDVMKLRLGWGQEVLRGEVKGLGGQGPKLPGSRALQFFSFPKCGWVVGWNCFLCPYFCPHSVHEYTVLLLRRLRFSLQLPFSEPSPDLSLTVHSQQWLFQNVLQNSSSLCLRFSSKAMSTFLGICSISTSFLVPIFLLVCSSCCNKTPKTG